MIERQLWHPVVAAMHRKRASNYALAPVAEV